MYDRAVSNEDTRSLSRTSLRESLDDDRVATPCLIVIRGLNVGETFRLVDGETVVGRGQQANFDLPDDGISRRHAAIRIAGGLPLLADLGSRNGTFVNGRRVHGEVVLADGDKIQLSPGTILKLAYADRIDESFQRRMYESSLRDPLTQSFNRKYFLDRLDRELRFSRRHGQPISLILVDVDGLRTVNVGQGAGAGDGILAELAGRVQAIVRQEDVVARTGGDELAIICRATGALDAAAVAERIRAAVAERAFGGAATRVTISAGVAGLDSGAPEPSDLLAAADGALAEAKRAGRNCVRIAA